jgi:hypothetical protein
VTDAAPIVMLVAAICSLWCAGIAFHQVPHVIGAAYSDRGGGSIAQEYLEAWTVVAPLLSIATIALIVGAIAGLAGRRGYNDLHTQASSKGVACVILMFANFAIQQWALAKATSQGTALFLLLCMLVAAMIGTVMMANLSTLTAQSLESEPSSNLPTATIV